MIFAAMSHRGWGKTGPMDGVGECYLLVMSQLVCRQKKWSMGGIFQKLCTVDWCKPEG